MLCKFKPLKTMKVTCKECGHVGNLEVREVQANTPIVNYIAKIRHDEREKWKPRLALARKALKDIWNEPIAKVDKEDMDIKDPFKAWINGYEECLVKLRGHAYEALSALAKGDGEGK